MNANSSPLEPTTVKEWLRKAVVRLKTAGITSARLDALILLETVLKKDRSRVLAHDDTLLQSLQLSRLNDALAKRARNIPLAYIRGFVEFYGRCFSVNEHVLIPRPETETIVEIALSLPIPDGSMVIDVGTGSGCIATCLSLERPRWRVFGTDISSRALNVATLNAKTLGADVAFYESDLLYDFPPPLTQRADLLVANLPYVAPTANISSDAKVEPLLALFANDSGYVIIERFLPQAAGVLKDGGYLLLESDPWQQPRLINSAAACGFILKKQYPFHLLLSLNASV